MNAMGAENRAGYMLQEAGYDLHNPCLSIIAEHRHCAAKTHARSIDSKMKTEVVHTSRQDGRSDLKDQLSLPGGRSRKGGSRLRGEGAAAARVDMPVSPEVSSRFAANVARWGIKAEPTTRFLWVEPSEHTRGVIQL